MKGRFVDKQRVRAGFFKVAKLRLFSIVMFQEMEHTSTCDIIWQLAHVTKSHPRNPVSPSQKTHFQELLENQCGQVCYFGNSESSFKAPRTPNIFSQIWGFKNLCFYVINSGIINMRKSVEHDHCCEG